MLIPHLHFCGDCAEAIHLYEKAFHTTVASIDCAADGKSIAHAAMSIHGQTVFLNDNFGNKGRTWDCAVHLILTFKTAEELLACYAVLAPEGDAAKTFYATPYSALCGNFMDRFGMLWGFMADAE